MDRRDFMAMTGGNKRPRVTIDTEDGEHDVLLPVRYEVCPTCEGKGHHVNPGIDAHGLTAEDLYDDPGFAEDYYSGMYDQTCNECHGKRVIEVVDEDRCDPELLKAYRDQQKWDRIFDAEMAAERRFGA